MTLSRPIETLLSGLIGTLLVSAILGIGYWQELSHLPAPKMVSATVTLDTSSSNAPSSSLTHTATIRKDWNSFTETQGDRRLPVIKQGVRVFETFRRPAVIPPLLAGEAAKPTLAVMVLGLGFNKENTLNALGLLPIEAGVALLPQAPYAADAMGVLRDTGRELWVHTPTDNHLANHDEGPEAIRFQAPAPANIALLQDTLSALTHYVGVVFSPHSAVAGSVDDMEPIMQELGTRGLGFGRLDPTPDLSTEQTALSKNVPLLPPARVISAPPFPATIRQYLDETLQIARENGGAVAVITEPNPVVIKTLIAWLEQHRNTDLTLVPPSALAAK